MHIEKSNAINSRVDLSTVWCMSCACWSAWLLQFNATQRYLEE